MAGARRRRSRLRRTTRSGSSSAVAKGLRRTSPGATITTSTGSRRKRSVGSGAWSALADAADEHHRAATEFVGQLDAVFLFTTDYIVDETVTLIRFRLSHQAAVAFLRSVHRSHR